MIKSLNELVEIAKASKEKHTVAVPWAEGEPVIHAVGSAVESGIVDAVLIGSEELIKKEAGEAKVDISKCRLLPAKDISGAIALAIKLIKAGEADILMKGNMNTDVLLHQVLNKEEGLKKLGLLSHVALFEIPDFSRLIIVTDAGVNINPDIMRKAEIIKNAVSVSHALGVVVPKVAILAAVEKVIFPAMPATRDAAILAQMGATGEFGKAVIEGPLALDNAISEEAAKIKGIKGGVAGSADILVTPNIEAGNILYKSLVYFSKASVAAVIVGLEVPFIVTSRSDSAEAKLFSIALASYLKANRKG